MVKKFIHIIFCLLFFIFIKIKAENEKTNVISDNPNSNVTIKTNETKPEKDSLKSNKSEKKEEDIYLNFENASLSSVVNYLSEIKKINIIPEPKLDSVSVTLTTKNALSLDRAWDILLTLLDLNGYTIINVNNLYRIVSKSGRKQEPLPSYSSGLGVEPEDLPDSDLTIRYTYFLKNVKAETIVTILTQILESGSVDYNTDLQALVITEKCLNIKAAMKVVKELDLGGLRESIKIVILKNTNAEDVATLFTNIIPADDKRSLRFAAGNKKQSSYFSSETKIFKEVRRNALILLGTEKNLQRIVDFINKYIDVPLTANECRLHIKELKFANAQTLVNPLKQVITMKGSDGKTLQMGEYKFFEDVIIAADSSQIDQGGGNRLVIACNKQDWERLSYFINKLDKPQPQVALEVIVADVSTDNNFDFMSQFDPKNNPIFAGISFYTANSYVPPTGSTTQLGEVTIHGVQGTSSQQVKTNLTFGNPYIGKKTLWAMIEAVLSKNNTEIITQPFLVTNNNNQAKIDINVGKKFKGKLDTNVGVQTVQKKVYQIAPSYVYLTPKINLEGLIEMRVDVSVSNFSEALTNQDPELFTRELHTSIKIQSGEVICLGGLTRSNWTEVIRKTPVLGDLPIICNFFKYKAKERRTSNLYVFIRPSIIKPRFDGQPDEYTQLKLDYAKYQAINVDSSLKEKDPIQRWFFKPEHTSIKEKVADAKEGIFRPIDNYAYGYNQPKDIDIKHDIYYRSTEEIEKIRFDEKKEVEKGLLPEAEDQKANLNLKSRNKNKKVI